MEVSAAGSRQPDSSAKAKVIFFTKFLFHHIGWVG